MELSLSTIIMYSIIGLFGVIGYFLKDKLSMYESRLDKLETQLDAHAKEDNIMHMKILEMHVTKAEYSETVNRIFSMLTVISEDIKAVMTTKVDK